MFQAPAFVKLSQEIGNGPSPPKDMCSLSARWSASLSPHHVLSLFPSLLPFSPLFQIRSNYSPLSDSDGGESNF